MRRGSVSSQCGRRPLLRGGGASCCGGLWRVAAQVQGPGCVACLDAVACSVDVLMHMRCFVDARNLLVRPTRAAPATFAALALLQPCASHSWPVWLCLAPQTVMRQNGGMSGTSKDLLRSKVRPCICHEERFLHARRRCLPASDAPARAWLLTRHPQVSPGLSRHAFAAVEQGDSEMLSWALQLGANTVLVSAFTLCGPVPWLPRRQTARGTAVPPLPNRPPPATTLAGRQAAAGARRGAGGPGQRARRAARGARQHRRGAAGERRTWHVGCGPRGCSRTQERNQSWAL